MGNHSKVYGFCESKCKVEVPTKTEFEALKSETSGEGLVQIVNTKLNEIGVVPTVLETITGDKTVNASDIVGKRVIYYNPTSLINHSLTISYDAKGDGYNDGSDYLIKLVTGNESGIFELGYTPSNQATDGIWNGHLTVPSRGAVEIEIIEL